MTDWGNAYPKSTTVPPAGQSSEPSLTKKQCMEIGSKLAADLLDETFAAKYLAVVKAHYKDQDRLLLDLYRPLIDSPFAGKAINEHDFANIHRAAWLAIVRGLARLVAFNPFEAAAHKNPWADPPTEKAVRRVELGKFFFEIPHPTGAYAIRSTDFDGYEQVKVGQLCSNIGVTCPAASAPVSADGGWRTAITKDASRPA